MHGTAEVDKEEEAKEVGVIVEADAVVDPSVGFKGMH